jgi:hypothetical protein
MQYYFSELLGFWTLSIVRYSRSYEMQDFGNWITFRPWGGETPTLLGSLERPNLKHCTTLVRVGVRVTSRLAVYRRSLCLGAKPLETHDQYFFELNTSGYCP